MTRTDNNQNLPLSSHEEDQLLTTTETAVTATTQEQDVPQATPANVIAAERHVEALRRVHRRETSYLQAMREYGYRVMIRHIVLKDGDGKPYQTQWAIAVLEESLCVFKTVFLDDGKASACPNLAKGCRSASDVAKLWRCQVRWSDVVSCEEGPYDIGFDDETTNPPGLSKRNSYVGCTFRRRRDSREDEFSSLLEAVLGESGNEGEEYLPISLPESDGL